MKKKILAGVLSAATVLTLTTGLTGCKEEGAGNNNSTSGGGTNDSKTEVKADNSGSKLRIACWNYELAEFVKAYVAPDDKINVGGKDITIEWVQYPNDDGVYQQNLDRMLKDNESASADEKIDMFLAEADYIIKYSCSDYSIDLKDMVKDTSNMYDYVVSAGKDKNGVLKAVSFQACPSALIVRRSIAKDVLGTDDPAEVQSKLDTWEKFEAVAADAKAKGYYMTGSAQDTYRVFANNSDTTYVNNGKFALTPAFNQWFDQAKKFVDNGYCTKGSLWAEEKTNEMKGDGKMMCTFGPAWYYAFSMGPAWNEATGSKGDWEIVKGPAGHFWGGTWMLAAKGTDNTDAVAEIMNKMCVDETVMDKLVKGEGLIDWTKKEPKTNPQFPNNKKVVDKYAADTSYGNAFLGGQNDLAIMNEIAKATVWDTNKHTAIDQTMNETLPNDMFEYLIGKEGVDSKEKALNNFYTHLAAVDPTITH